MTTQPRWYQLTYTSADHPGASHGGWGVKECTPGTPTDIEALLRKGAITRLEEGVPTSQFAANAELLARPRRLQVSDHGVDDVVFWHAAAAGTDATGRPGNVFTHAAMVATPSAGLRPIDYWRSEDWLVPFGVQEVNAAKLGELRPGSAVSRRTTVDGLIEGDTRFKAEWLLAALDDVRRREATLVIGTESADEAARWIGVLSHLTSAAHARYLRWVTYERASNLPKLTLSERLDIVCVPVDDLEAVLADQSELIGRGSIVAVDLRWVLDDAIDGTWYHEGHSWPAEPRWQNAMLDLLSLPRPSIEGVLEVMDDITGALDATSASELPYAWPLSVAMLATGSPITDRDGVKAEFLSVIPQRLAGHPRLAGLVPAPPTPRKADPPTLAKRPEAAPSRAPQPVLERTAESPTWGPPRGYGKPAASAPRPVEDAAPSEPRDASPSTAAPSRDASANHVAIEEAVKYLDSDWVSDDGPPLPASCVEGVRARLGDLLAGLETDAHDLARHENAWMAGSAARLAVFLRSTGISPKPSFPPDPVGEAIGVLAGRLASLKPHVSAQTLQAIRVLALPPPGGPGPIRPTEPSPARILVHDALRARRLAAVAHVQAATKHCIAKELDRLLAGATYHLDVVDLELLRSDPNATMIGARDLLVTAINNGTFEAPLAALYVDRAVDPPSDASALVLRFSEGVTIARKALVEAWAVIPPKRGASIVKGLTQTERGEGPRAEVLRSMTPATTNRRK